MGYAETSQRGQGIHLRQFARAFIIQDNAGRRVVYVSAEIAGISVAMRRDVSSSLSTKIKLRVFCSLNLSNNSLSKISPN